MTIQAQYLETSYYLQATLSGDWTEPAIKAALDDVRAQADLRGFKTLLLDLDELSRPDCEMTRFFSGEHLAQVLGPPFVVAAYARPELINRFAETVALNRAACFAVFPERKQAIAWLAERTGQPPVCEDDTTLVP
jgi:hypothetical protein